MNTIGKKGIQKRPGKKVEDLMGNTEETNNYDNVDNYHINIIIT